MCYRCVPSVGFPYVSCQLVGGESVSWHSVSCPFLAASVCLSRVESDVDDGVVGCLQCFVAQRCGSRCAVACVVCSLAYSLFLSLVLRLLLVSPASIPPSLKRLPAFASDPLSVLVSLTVVPFFVSPLSASCRTRSVCVYVVLRWFPVRWVCPATSLLV